MSLAAACSLAQSNISPSQLLDVLARLGWWVLVHALLFSIQEKTAGAKVSQSVHDSASTSLLWPEISSTCMLPRLWA